MKQIVLKSRDEVAEHIETILQSASDAQMNIIEIAENRDTMWWLEKVKFEKIGYDPLDSSRPLNFIEQVNQTFTYLASLSAAELLFQWHTEVTQLTLNLGTSSGSDIETLELGGIAVEIFSATSPSSNNKLNKDIKKVAGTIAAHKYVFFNCPGIPEGWYKGSRHAAVKIWALAG
ncbi:MAG: hypothetical protein ACI82A_003338 [Candidatus Azotimanducaceae bacterium]|jgi:hypothetical protein